MTKQNQNIILAIQARLDELLTAEKPQNPFAVFDFDNTCIHNDIGEATLAYLCRHRLLRSRTLLPHYDFVSEDEYAHALFHYYYALMDSGEKEKAYLFAARVLAGYTKSEIYKIVDEVLQREGEILGKDTLFGRDIAKGLRVKETTKALIEYFVRKNIACWIVSASPELLVQAAVSRLFKEFKLNVIGVRITEENGVLGVAALKPAPMFGGKVECIKAYIDPTAKPILVAGDSEGDLAMLQYAHTRVVVDVGSSFTERMRARTPQDWFVL